MPRLSRFMEERTRLALPAQVESLRTQVGRYEVEYVRDWDGPNHACFVVRRREGGAKFELPVDAVEALIEAVRVLDGNAAERAALVDPDAGACECPSCGFVQRELSGDVVLDGDKLARAGWCIGHKIAPGLFINVCPTCAEKL